MNIRNFTVDFPTGSIEMIELSDDLGNATQMPKAIYDAQQGNTPTGLNPSA